MTSGGKSWRGTVAGVLERLAKWGRKVGRWLVKWGDEWKMAGEGVLLATRDWRFLTIFGGSLVVFGTLMTLLSGSAGAIGLFWSVNWTNKLKILSDALLGFFGMGQSFWDWALIFSITVIQSILIGLVALVWRRKRKMVKKTKTKADDFVAGVQNADNAQSAGLAAGLAILGSGCPTCGTTLLAPVLGTLFSTGGYAIAGMVSGILMILSFIVALVALKKVGREAYMVIKSEEFAQRKEQNGRK